MEQPMSRWILAALIGLALSIGLITPNTAQTRKCSSSRVMPYADGVLIQWTLPETHPAVVVIRERDDVQTELITLPSSPIRAQWLDVDGRIGDRYLLSQRGSDQGVRNCVAGTAGGLSFIPLIR
jgi:hypothetical protein